MTTGKGKNWDWATEWSKAIKTFPKWTPNVHFYGDSDHPVLTRLCTYPEMGYVWERIYKWWELAQKKNGYPYTESRFDYGCVRVITEFALKCIQPKLGLATLTVTKRQKLIENMVRQARALSNTLRELEVPESISYYIDWETRFEEVRQVQSTFLCDNFLEEKDEYHEALHRLSNKYSGDVETFGDDSMGNFQAPHEQEITEESLAKQLAFLRDRFPHLSDEKIIEGMSLLNEPLVPEPPADLDEELLSQLQELLKHQILREIRIPSKVTVYDILTRIIGLENEKFQEPIVKKSKDKNAPKLLAIRLYAKLLKHALERNPKSKEERAVIAMLVRTVLDDPDIGEDTVKDALKQYEI